MANELCLRSLDLGVVAGKPGEDGWDDVRGFEKGEFEVMRRVKGMWGGDAGMGELEWVEQLFQVKGLKRVGVKALMEYCPRPMSEGMAFWIAFSKSIEGGFGEWVREGMVSRA